MENCGYGKDLTKKNTMNYTYISTEFLLIGQKEIYYSKY